MKLLALTDADKRRAEVEAEGSEPHL